MRNNSHLSIILITSQEIIRADTGTDTDSPKIIRQSRPTVDEHALLVEAALHLSDRRPGKVWVFSEDIWIQLVQLPGTAARSSPEQLSRVLAFETEALSGISPFESALGFAKMTISGYKHDYCIQQLHAPTVQHVNEVVRAAGGKLIGLRHPGGLPKPIHRKPQRDRSWSRVELWSNTVVVLHQSENGPVAMNIINIGPGDMTWPERVDGWLREFNDAGSHEFLAAPASGPDDYPCEHKFRLDSDTDLASWLTYWAESLAHGDKPGPYIAPPRFQLTSMHRTILAVVVWICVATACAGHYAWIWTRQQSIEQQLKSIDSEKSRLDELQKRRASFVSEIATLREQIGGLRDDVENSARDLDLQQQRFARLLQALSSAHSQDLLIETITQNGVKTLIHGTVLQSSQAEQFAHRLDQELADVGWDIAPPEKSGKNILANGGPWTFEIQLTPSFRRKENRE